MLRNRSSGSDGPCLYKAQVNALGGGIGNGGTVRAVANRERACAGFESTLGDKIVVLG